MMRNFVFIVSLLLSVGITQAQLNLTDVPKDGAFLPRNTKTNMATCLVKGFVTDVSFNKLEVKVYQSDSLIQKHPIQLRFVNGQSKFNLPLVLPAGKFKYTLQLSLIGKTQYVHEVDNILVGDVYLIQGQSNSVAASYNAFDKTYYDSFIRSFGSSYPNASIAGSDTNWYNVDGDKVYNKGSVGQWGAVMAKQLLDSFHIPICIINGAVGGTRIALHTPDPNNALNLNTIYGRLLYRVQKAKLENHVRGILYFQGESDGGYAQLHDSLFRKVVQGWQRDFAGYEKLYVIQVRSGCGGPSIQLRDVQRKFEFSLADCQTVSANGLNNHDGCHYGFVNGYELLGIQLSALVGRDFYDGHSDHIDPPNIESCYYSNASQTEITLTMQNEGDSIFTDNQFQKLFRIEGDPTVSIANGFVRDNKVVLQLNKSSCQITGLTYDGLPRSQPWVKSASKMGLVSFYNVPIKTNRIKTFYRSCKNEDATLGEDSIAGCTYLWKRLAGGKTYTTAQPKIAIGSLEEFVLILTYANTVCKKKDTITVFATPDYVDLPDLGSDTTLCPGDVLRLNPHTTGFVRFEWETDSKKGSSWTYTVSSAETIKLSATSNWNCVYRDTVEVEISTPTIKLPQGIQICPNTDTLITAIGSGGKYLWNGYDGGASYRATAGKWVVEVMDSIHCSAFDSTTITSFKPIESLHIVETKCEGNSLKIDKPRHLKLWKENDSILADNIRLVAPQTLAIQLIDSNNCGVNDTIVLKAHNLPRFDLGPDTGYCANSYVDIILPEIGFSYYWNDEIQNKPFARIDSAGEYYVRVMDTNYCHFSDTIQIVEYSLPFLTQFHDSTLCIGERWKIPLSSQYVYTVNHLVVQDTVVFSKEDDYYITVQNRYLCMVDTAITIKYVDCNSSMLNLDAPRDFEVYPNPFESILNLEIDGNFPFDGVLVDTYGREVHSFKIKTSGRSRLDLAHLAKGVYFMHIGQETIKLVKR